MRGLFADLVMYLLKPYKRANVWINIAPYRAFFNCTYRIDIDYRVAERGTWLIHLADLHGGAAVVAANQTAVWIVYGIS